MHVADKASVCYLTLPFEGGAVAYRFVVGLDSVDSRATHPIFFRKYKVSAPAIFLHIPLEC